MITAATQSLRATDRRPILALVTGAGMHAMASFSLLAVAALVFQQAQVGIIALVIALQFVLSQGFSLGINLAVLYRASDTSKTPASPFHGLMNVLLVSVALSVVFLFVFGRWGSMLFPKELVGMRWHLAAYGVLAACVKVFLVELNAVADFRRMGLVLGLRGLLVAIAVAGALVIELTPSVFVWLAVVLPEAVAVLLYLIYAVRHPVRFNPGRAWSLLRADLRFGTRAITGALLLESAIKADVLMLGAMTDARTTGLYAVVSVISDLFIQCMVFARVFLNPRYTEAYSASGAEGVLRLAGRVLRWGYPLGALAASLLVGGSLLAVHAIPDFMAYREAMPAVLVLWVFLCLTAGFFPLFQLLGQVGRPLHQSATYTALFMANVLFNALLIPHWGATGAALATGLAYVVHAAFLAIILRSMSTSSTPIA